MANWSPAALWSRIQTRRRSFGYTVGQSVRYQIDSIAASALRHGVSRAQIEYVVAHYVVIEYEPPDDDHKYDILMFLGHNRNLVPLEVGALLLTSPTTASTNVRVIHADSMQEKYRSAYEAALSLL